VLVRLLVAADGVEQRRRVERLVAPLGAFVTAFSGRRRLWQRLTGADVDLVLLSGTLVPQPASLVASLRELPERPEVIVLAAKEDPAERAALLAAGCLAVLFEGLPDEALTEALRALVARRREQALQGQSGEGQLERSSLADFVSASPAMQAFLDVARRVVQSDSSLLILGETGVGKERLARAIHAEGPRVRGPFVAVNCGALPEGLLESELFGHERGAFTGATRSRRGYFELADGGTLFLDEVADLPPHLQVKLLRALEDRRVHRVGGERPIPVNVRIMAATNRTPETEVEGQRLRADLYYRLAVVTLTVPPLRERQEDIPPLAYSYLQHFSLHLGRHVTGISAEALDSLMRYPWPGNVRELINVIERAVLLCGGTELGVADLPRTVTGGRGPGHARVEETLAFGAPLDRLQGAPLKQARREVVAAFERRYLGELLQTTGGRIGETARHAGINERSLYALMRRHGLTKEAFKEAPRGDRRLAPDVSGAAPRPER
jgi:DNA-binding NtrC family response regulator